MLRRLPPAALAVLLAVGTGAPAQAPSASPEVSVQVLSRARGAKDYRLLGTYTVEAAPQVAAQLRAQGYDVLQARTPARGPTPAPPEASPNQTTTPAQVRAAFQAVAAQPDIAFRYPADGCYARCHLLVRQLEALGLAPSKLWAFSDGEDLYIRTRHHPRGYVRWSYHVAPAVRARLEDGRRQWLVLDPSLFDGPVSVAQWEQALMRGPTSPRPFLTLTWPGQAPVRPKAGRAEGSGYWPSADPAEGPDAHAASVMRRFKPYEDRWPPKGWPGGPQQQAKAAPVAPPPPPPRRTLRERLFSGRRGTGS
jgi:hypothetical protein